MEENAEGGNDPAVASHHDLDIGVTRQGRVLDGAHAGLDGELESRATMRVSCNVGCLPLGLLHGHAHLVEGVHRALQARATGDAAGREQFQEIGALGQILSCASAETLRIRSSSTTISASITGSAPLPVKSWPQCITVSMIRLPLLAHAVKRLL